MPRGFEAKGPDGVVKLDHNFANLMMIQKGTYPQNGLPTLAGATVMATIKASAEPASYQWFTFGPPTSSASYGLQVFGPTGQLNFCAIQKAARVVDAFTIGAIGSAAKTRNYAAGKTYATIVSFMPFTEVQLRGVGIGQEYRIVRRYSYATVSGATVVGAWAEDIFQDWQPVPPGGAASFPAPAYDPWVVVLDVTGY